MTIKLDIVSQYQNRGAKLAETSMAKLGKQAKALGAALGIAYSAQKIVAFGKSSVEEFKQAESAAMKLQNVLKNTGQLMSFPETISGLKNLSKLSGIQDDELIPSFQSLYLATGNASQALDTLNLAINVARGSNNDLNTVVTALSKGYAGNTKGLAGLQVGLSKAYLATGDMAGITKQLNDQFKGASTAYLDTYAGKMEVLSTNFKDMQQIIGQGLIIAAQKATGDMGIGGVSNAMENLGYFTAAATIKLGYLIDKMNSIPVVGGLLDRVVKGWSYLLGVDEVRMQLKNEEWRQNTKLLEQAYAQAELQKKAAADYAKFLAKQKALANAQAKKEADAARLKKASQIVQMDQIQIMAALQGKITDEEKLRLQLQMALLQDNGSEAERLSNELLKSQLLTTGLANAIRNLPMALNPFANWSSYTAAATAVAASAASSYIGSAQEVALAKQISNAQGNRLQQEFMNPESGAYNSSLFGSSGGGTYVDVQVSVGGQQLTDVVTNTQINNSASGISSSLNRLALMD